MCLYLTMAQMASLAFWAPGDYGNCGRGLARKGGGQDTVFVGVVGGHHTLCLDFWAFWGCGDERHDEDGPLFRCAHFEAGALLLNEEVAKGHLTFSPSLTAYVRGLTRTPALQLPREREVFHLCTAVPSFFVASTHSS